MISQANSNIRSYVEKRFPDESDRKEFYSGYANKNLYLEAVKELMNQQRKKFDLDIGYETPAWAEMQADRIGYNRALDNVESILSQLLGDTPK